MGSEEGDGGREMDAGDSMYFVVVVVSQSVSQSTPTGRQISCSTPTELKPAPLSQSQHQVSSAYQEVLPQSRKAATCTTPPKV
jgi:hypothetical protein